MASSETKKNLKSVIIFDYDCRLDYKTKPKKNSNIFYSSYICLSFHNELLNVYEKIQFKC